MKSTMLLYRYYMIVMSTSKALNELSLVVPNFGQNRARIVDYNDSVLVKHILFYNYHADGYSSQELPCTGIVDIYSIHLLLYQATVVGRIVFLLSAGAVEYRVLK